MPGTVKVRSDRIENDETLDRRLRFPADGAGDGVWEWNIATGAIAVSPRWLVALGYAPDEDIRSVAAWHEKIHPDDLARTRAYATRQVGLGEAITTELRIRAKAGHYRWMHARALIENDAAGRPVKMIGWLIDITEAKEHESQAPYADARWKSLTELAPTGIFECDASGANTFINDRWCEITGLTREMGLGHGWKGALHPDDADHVCAAAKTALSTGLRFEEKYRFRRPNGSVVRVHCLASPTPSGYVGVIFDVTELYEARTFIERIAATTPDVLYVFDQETMSNVWVNDTFQTLTGWSPEEYRALGPRALGEFIHPDDVEHLLRVAQSEFPRDEGAVRHVRYRICRKGGGVVAVHDCQSAFTRDASGRVTKLVGVLRDVTAVVQAEAAAAAASKLATLGEMAAGIAHEINNPLSIIKMGSDQLVRLSRRPGALDVERVASAAARIGDTAGRIARIVSGLLEFARDDTGAAFTEADLRGVITETLALCAERVRQRGVRLVLPEPGTEVRCACHPVQISQVLLNLLSNAFDAIEGMPDPWIELGLTSTPEGVELTVTDSGPGIPAPLRDRIMQPFFTTKVVGKGTGLGLSIASSIATAHGGSLALDAGWPQTRFVLRLPRR